MIAYLKDKNYLFKTIKSLFYKKLLSKFFNLKLFDNILYFKRKY